MGGCAGSPTPAQTADRSQETPDPSVRVIHREELDRAGGVTLGDALRRTTSGIYVRPGS